MRVLIVTILLTNVVVLCMSASILGEFTFASKYCVCALGAFECSSVRSCVNKLCISRSRPFSFAYISFFFFSKDFLTGENESRQNNGDSGSKNCICNDNQCICCLDFNISFIDLGGPGELGCARLERNSCHSVHMKIEKT